MSEYLRCEVDCSQSGAGRAFYGSPGLNSFSARRKVLISADKAALTAAAF